VALAIIQEWIEPETDRSTTNYDAISEKLSQQEPPDGLRVHSAGYTGNGFRIFEIWDSRAQYDRFLSDRLMPMIMEQGGGDQPPAQPTMTVYELHNYVTF
jgi:hypothetical protein